MGGDRGSCSSWESRPIGKGVRTQRFAQFGQQRFDFTTVVLDPNLFDQVVDIVQCQTRIHIRHTEENEQWQKRYLLSFRHPHTPLHVCFFTPTDSNLFFRHDARYLDCAISHWLHGP